MLKKAILFLLVFLFIFQAIPVSALEFSDVNNNDWYYKNVISMSEKGYLKGYPNGSFKPNSIITAAEYVSVVARVFGLDASTNTQINHWASPLLQSALDKGWYDWDEIPPIGEKYDVGITRQLAVKILMKAFAPDERGNYSTEVAKINDFSTLDGRYYDYVIAAYSKNIVYGDDKGNFNAKSNLTRAEACAMITRATEKLGIDTKPYEDKDMDEGQENDVTITTKKGVSQNGHLKVVGTQLCNEKGEAVVLRGMSSHGIQWFPQFLSKAVIKSTADSGANLFRVAMYTDENGYISNPSVKQTLIKAVDNAISLDMYVIIDWHILHDGNPNTYKVQAKAFFEEIAKKYKNNPAVIYEICNEPNGNISWNNDVKPYAEDVIKTIRSIDSNAIILVGSTTWSQDLQEVAKNPIKANNIMYTCHFYAGTHTQWLRDRISTVMKQNIPVFISEWGMSDSSGNGNLYTDETNKWLDFLNKNHISWANWSLCDKNESTAAIKSRSNINDGITANELTPSGKYVFSHFSD